jgi:hypothetical protein
MVLETISPFDIFAQTGDRTIEEAEAVIAAGHPPEAEGVVMIDFDATIAPFGYLFAFPEPFDGVYKFMNAMKGKGYTLGVFTSRLSPLWLNSVNQTAKQHTDYIYEYCDRYGLPIDFVTAEKRPCIAYIDDKAIEFKNNWAEIGLRFGVT